METSGMSPAKLAVMVGFALSCFGLLLFLWLAFGGPVPLKPKGYQFQVAFPDSATLADQAEVRIAGVSVGRVVARERAPEGNQQLATLELDAPYAPVRSDAKAMLRQKTLLGETYVELTGGSESAPYLDEDGRLSDGQVRDAVHFDEMLRTLDPPTRRAFQRWQEGMRENTEGRAQDINDSLGNLSGFAESGSDLLQLLERRRSALRQLVRETGTTFSAISRDQAALQTLIRRNREVFDTLASEREALTETFQIMPTFQAETRATMERLGDFAVNTEPLIRDLDPVLEELVPTLRDVGRLSPDLRALFNDLPELIAAGDRGLPALSRVLRHLDPTLAELGPFLQQLNPILEFLELYQATITDFLNVGPSALHVNPFGPQGKSRGHMLPQNIVLGSESVPQDGNDPEDRLNAYFSPDAFNGESMPHLTLPAWQCPLGEHPPREDMQGCWLQRPFEFQGRVQKYPHVRPAPRGGASRGRGVDTPSDRGTGGPGTGGGGQRGRQPRFTG